MDRARHAKQRGVWPDAVTGPLLPGMTLGRYELLVPVGVGGMACVWAARLSGHRGFSKLVAIKTILAHLTIHRDFENMLLDEARIAAEAHHPNVCNLFDVGEEQGILYLVLEWVNGDSLLQVLRGAQPKAITPLDYRIAARIVADACAGLHAAHELTDEGGKPLDVVHRDVSPHNILVSLDGTTKVADFGIAKAQGQLHQATRTGELRGKLAYMAPEQMNGAPLDRRADIFAMGSVLYHATTGQAPFRGDTDVCIIRAVLDADYEAPTRIVEDYPPALAAIVGRALSARPEDRFETAERMQNALEVWLASEGRVTTINDVAEVVRQRIGAKLEQRRQQVRAAIDAEPATGSTRPVGAPPRASESGTVRALGMPGDSHASSDFHAPSIPSAAEGAPHSHGSAGTLRRFLKTSAAVVLGLVAAALVLLLRSLAGHVNLERASSLSLASSHVAALPFAASPGSTAAPSPPPVQTSPLSSAVASSTKDADSATLAPSSPPVARSASTVPVSASTPGRRDVHASNMAPRPNCDPPYTFDALGQKHFKPVCYR